MNLFGYSTHVIFIVQLAEVLILMAAALIWARWSKLDLGLRPPALKGVWLWIFLYTAWFGAELAVVYGVQPNIDPNWLQDLEQVSLAEELVLIVLLGPIQEELLFRGAFFSALMRRWGVAIAIVIPSALWGLMHAQYEAWYMASIAASGIILAIIRWKSGSLYIPLALHVGGNLLDTLLSI